jgi:hypothetical protein
MTILVDFGNPKGTFGDPKKGRNPQFEKRWFNQSITLSVILFIGAHCTKELATSVLVCLIR